jgi:3,4-dihydroxy 2-butanone 4-phosphate synthase / GTP cyclohydrolase II
MLREAKRHDKPQGRCLTLAAHIPKALVEHLAQGRLVVLADGRGRGHGIIAGIAAWLTAQGAALMAVHARGLLSITVDQQAAFRLGLKRMPKHCGHTVRSMREFLVSIEASACEGSGISARDRALTIRRAGALGSTHQDVIMPGHIPPLLVGRHEGEELSLPEIAHLVVTERCGFPVATWCDILNDRGDVASFSECRALANAHDLAFADVEGMRSSLSKARVPALQAGQAG